MCLCFAGCLLLLLFIVGCALYFGLLRFGVFGVVCCLLSVDVVCRLLLLVCGVFPSLMSTLGCCLAFVVVICCALRMFGAVVCLLMTLCWLLFLPVVCCCCLLLFDIWCL